MKKRLEFDLILLGDPTSGKDTQAKILMSKFLLKPVESGKYWRRLAKRDNFEGRWLRRTMSIGHPTPVVLMKKFLNQQVGLAPKDKDLIFIGNPRLKPEAQLLKKLLGQKKRDFFGLYIKIPVSEILKRTANRPRLKTEVKGVRNRIKYTKEQVSKTVKYFSEMGKLKFVKGNQSVSKVQKDIIKVINDYKKRGTN